MSEKVLITGASGFIGYNLASRLLDEGFSVYGIDAMFGHGRYEIFLKRRRLENLYRHKNSKRFSFAKCWVDSGALSKVGDVDCIVHLAGISGIERFEHNQDVSRRITITAAESVMRFADRQKVPIIYASSSSIYGNINVERFSESIADLKPISSYAETRLYVERMLLGSDVNSIGLRFFTVYGEFGRPDMSYFIFTDRIFRNAVIYLYGKRIKRDFTYVGDVVESLIRLIKNKGNIFNKEGDKLILNVGRGSPIMLEGVIDIIAEYLDRKPRIVYRKERHFDMKYTCADNRLLRNITGYVPQTDIRDGLNKFVRWYKNYFIKYK